MKAAPLGLRLFLEGIEVPVISAQVNINPDRPSAAAIQVIPTGMGMHLLPRTLVHLFYLDAEISDEEVAAAREKAEISVRNQVGVEDNELNRYEVADYQYKILFSGEIIGFQYAKTPASRQLVLQCLDLSSYWDTCYQFFADYSVGGTGLTDKTHQFVGSNAGLFDNVASGHRWMISRLLNTRPASPQYQQAKGMLGGIIHLLEAVGGIKYGGNNNRGFGGANDFFSIAELRYNLLGMLGAIEGDTSSSKIYARKAFNHWIRNGMASLGTLLSFRDIVNHLNRYVFHNIYPNPCAYYKSEREGLIPKTFKVKQSIITDSSTGAAVHRDIKRTYTKIAKAQGLYESAAGAGAFTDFRAGEKALRDAEVYLLNMPSLLDLVKTDDVNNVKQSIRSARSKVDEALAASPLTEPSFPPNSADDNEALFEGLRRTENFLERAKKAAKLCEDAAGELESLIGPLNRGKKRVRKKVKALIGANLFNQLFLPETFFVSPPRCNVIFPDEYFSFSFSRNFAREITRLSCQGGLGIIAGGHRGGAKALGRHYFAPNIKDVRGKTLRATLSRGARVIMLHETHSGIIPKFEWVTDGHRWGIKGATQTGRIRNVKKEQRISYIARLANFQFFLHRWGSRSMTMQGIFMPRLVLGFPCVVLDKPAPPPDVIDKLVQELGNSRPNYLPLQYVGKITSLVHSVSQAGGQTNVGFSYCRTHRSLDDEFLRVLSKEITEEGSTKQIKVEPKKLAEGTYGGSARRLTIRRRIYERWAKKTLKKGMRLRGLGRVTQVQESGAKTTLDKAEFTRLHHWLKSDDFNKLDRKEVKDEDDNLGISTKYVIEVPQSITVKYKPRVGTGRYERVTQFEEAARPGWMSENVWNNDNIGEKVYEHLLGTVAITDDKSIGKAAQEELIKIQKADSSERVTRIEIAPQVIEGGATDSGETGFATVETLDSGDDRYVIVEGGVEETIDGIAMVYGLIRNRGANVHEFIRRFTERPIANIIDILGTQNLQFDSEGNIKDPETMREGFHSRAFGDYNAEKDPLAVLFAGEAQPTKVKRASIISGKKEETIRADLDPRGRAYRRVNAYLRELRVSRGLLGT